MIRKETHANILRHSGVFCKCFKKKLFTSNVSISFAKFAVSQDVISLYYLLEKKSSYLNYEANLYELFYGPYRF